MGTRVVLNSVKVMAAIAGLVFWFCPLSSSTQILIFVASLIVLFICAMITHNLDDTQSGYWPPRPSDVLPRAKKSEAHKNAPGDGSHPKA